MWLILCVFTIDVYTRVKNGKEKETATQEDDVSDLLQ